jgi:outer membrane protein assembly factor BamB
MMMLDMSFSPAVVPIVVNAGAAILPAIVAGAASFFGLLMRPRELVRTCRRRPFAALSTVGGMAAAGIGIWLLLAHAGGGKRSAAADFWDSVAKQRIAGDVIAATGPGMEDGTRPVGLGRDFSRCNYDGAGAPQKLRQEPLWSAEKDGYVLSSPVVRGGRVYGAGVVFSLAGQAGVIFCRDVVTGKTLWRCDAKEDDEPLKPFFSTPTITADGKYLVIGQGLHDDHNCELLILDAETGKIMHMVATELHIESSPAVYKHPKYGDMVVAGCGAIEGLDHKPTGHAGYVLAVQIASGKTLWTYNLADPESSPAIGEDGTVYIGSGFNGNAVEALRSETDADLNGASRNVWRFVTPYPATGAVTIAGDVVLIGCGNGDYVVSDPHPKGAVYALDRKTGMLVWKYDTEDAVLGEIAVRGKLVLAPCKTGEVLALTLDGGKKLWSERISGRNGVLSGVTLTETRAYAVSKDGYLGVLDVTEGAKKRLLESVPINDEKNPGDQGLCFSAPTVVGGRIYVGSETGGIRCIAGTELVK